MTEEELREKIAKFLLRNVSVFKCNNQAFNNTFLFDDLAKDVADHILTLIRESGVFMDTEMVKGLMFEVQAKKCDQCPKNRMVSVNETP